MRARRGRQIGLEKTSQIGRIVVDPSNPNRVYVAALGHVYDANPERGVYRSTDGGAHWKKVLFNASDPNDVGAIDIAIDPKDAKVLYASLWATRRPPWSVYAPSYMPGSGLYKSTDGGDHWTKLSGGLPDDNFVGKIGIAVSPSNPQRLWAVVDDVGASVAPPLRLRGRRFRQAGSEADGRRVPFRRRGSDVEAGERRDAAVGPRLVFRIGHGGPGQSGQGLRDQHCDVCDDGCGQDVGRRSRVRRVAMTITSCG